MSEDFRIRELDSSGDLRPIRDHWLELAVRVLATLIVSIFVPLSLNLFLDEGIQPLDQFFLGALVFFSISLVGMVLDIARIRLQQEKEARLRFIEDEFREKLYNIEQAYRMILRRRRNYPDLYSQYFERVIEDLEQDIRRAAEQGELEADEKHVETTDLLYSCLQGRDEDILRLVHFMEDNDFMYSTYQQTYYRRMIDLLEEGRVKEVRRLFVYEEGQEEWESSQKLIDFHRRQPGYRCRLILENEFKNFCADQGINESYTDFGIYGDWYVYSSRSADPEGDVVGVYYSSENVVDEYVQLFDNCWNHGDIPESITDKEEPMSLSELFGEEPSPPDELFNSVK